MSATLAPTAAPPNALKVWCDARSVYVELPNKPNAQPAILSFRRDGPGLAKVLNLIYGHAEVSGAILSQPKKFIADPALHAMAEAALRRKGFI